MAEECLNEILKNVKNKKIWTTNKEREIWNLKKKVKRLMMMDDKVRKKKRKNWHY
jgi:TATA-binding protein-associated factor Taf7